MVEKGGSIAPWPASCRVSRRRIQKAAVFLFVPAAHRPPLSARACKPVHPATPCGLPEATGQALWHFNYVDEQLSRCSCANVQAACSRAALGT